MTGVRAERNPKAKSATPAAATAQARVRTAHLHAVSFELNEDEHSQEWGLSLSRCESLG